MIITVYIIPITFGIISIYTSINLKLGTEQDLINIGYIYSINCFFYFTNFIFNY